MAGWVQSICLWVALFAIAAPATADVETDTKLRNILTAESIPDDLAAALLDPATGYPEDERYALLLDLESLRQDRAVADAYALRSLAEAIRKQRGADDPVAALFAARAVGEYVGASCSLFEDDKKRAALEAAVAALAKLPADHPAAAEARAALSAYHLDHLRLQDALAALGNAPSSPAQLIARSRIKRMEGRAILTR